MKGKDVFWIWKMAVFLLAISPSKQQKPNTLAENILDESEVNRIIEKEFYSFKSSYRNMNKQGKSVYSRANHK